MPISKVFVGTRRYAWICVDCHDLAFAAVLSRPHRQVLRATGQHDAQIADCDASSNGRRRFEQSGYPQHAVLQR